MRPQTPDQLRDSFLEFFAARGHAMIPSASLLPENDPSVLFTTAGMHPLVPYLLGEPHPLGTRLTNSQKCIRTQDIDEVGDRRHTTLFEMLGAWSLGDYGRDEIIAWTFEFFTTVMELDPYRLSVSVFEGDDRVSFDRRSADRWELVFKRRGIELGERLVPYGRAKNWWGPAGITGPCGPDTEIFFDTGRAHDPAFGPHCHPNCDCGRFVEIGNDVLMEYRKEGDGSFVPLAKKNVDVGWGLERLLSMSLGLDTIFLSPFFSGAIKMLEKLSGQRYGDPRASRSMEIVADHVRAATFILADPRGVVPSNVDQGYVLRRFIRRAIRHARLLGIHGSALVPISATFIELMRGAYPELARNASLVERELQQEEQQFGKTLVAGTKHVEKLLRLRPSISGEEAFHLYETFGFPLELTEELAREHGLTVDRNGYQQAFTAHQALSRSGSERRFAGGLAGDDDRSVRMHTATHLLHAALRQVLGPHVEQRGSNITTERLRFDFSHGEKLTREQLAQIEKLVNEQIVHDSPIAFTEMTVDEAKSQGVIGLFEERYGARVKVYSVGTFSREICGGPHVARSALIGRFTIAKEEASSKGVRRIKATVDDDASIPVPLPIAGRAAR